MRKTMIVVDDDPDILDSIKTLFEHEGYEVFTAKNGMECLDKLENGFRGVILLDIMMPGMDGWDTVKEIVNRGLVNNVNIFVITAIGTSDHKKMKGLEPYIFDYIPKPFDPAKLVKSVKQADN